VLSSPAAAESALRRVLAATPLPFAYEVVVPDHRRRADDHGLIARSLLRPRGTDLVMIPACARATRS
jgi:hypothetical protein